MRATILPAREVREVDARTVADLLKALGLHRDAHLVVRGDDILTADVRLAAGDEVEVWPVISGGNCKRGQAPPSGIPPPSGTSGAPPAHPSGSGRGDRRSREDRPKHRAEPVLQASPVRSRVGSMTQTLFEAGQ